MDAIKNIGFKEVIGTILLGFLFYKLVEWCRGGESRMKSSQVADQDSKTPLTNRVASEGGLKGHDSQKEKREGGELMPKAVPSILSTEVQPMKKVANQNQGEVDLSLLEGQLGILQIMDASSLELVEGTPVVSVSTLESELEFMVYEASDYIHIFIEESSIGDLRKLINLLQHPDYANKLDQIKYVDFKFCFANHEYLFKDIQDLMNLFSKFKNLCGIELQDIPRELMAEWTGSGDGLFQSDITLEDFIQSSNALDFCDHKIKLNLKQNALLKSITFTNGKFDDDYLVQLTCEGLEPQWALNCNLIKQWIIGSKIAGQKSWYELPSKKASVEEWLRGKSPEFLEAKRRQWEAIRLENEEKMKSEADQEEMFRKDEEVRTDAFKAKEKHLQDLERNKKESYDAWLIRERQAREADWYFREGQIWEINAARMKAEEENVLRKAEQKEKKEALEARRIAENERVANLEYENQVAKKESNIQQQEEETPQNETSQAVDVKDNKDKKARS